MSGLRGRLRTRRSSSLNHRRLLKGNDGYRMLLHQCAHYSSPRSIWTVGRFHAETHVHSSQFAIILAHEEKARPRRREIDEPKCWMGMSPARVEGKHLGGTVTRTRCSDSGVPSEGLVCSFGEVTPFCSPRSESVSCTLIQCAGAIDAEGAVAGRSATLRPRSCWRLSAHPSIRLPKPVFVAPVFGVSHGPNHSQTLGPVMTRDTGAFCARPLYWRSTMRARSEFLGQGGCSSPIGHRVSGSLNLQVGACTAR